ncbi:MAG TPA: FAD-dependent oxidoreductase [Gemmatimonadaceae bacterium]|nr:FAD-dependent oxidoreductase [Gemmatimonadaceae bacterium]
MGSFRNTSVIRRATALLALAMRVYLAFVWIRFGLGKIETGWLTSNPLRPLVDLVAKGYTNALLPIYEPLARWALTLGIDSALSIAFPIIELTIALALITGVALRPMLLVATFINLNLVLSGLAPWTFDSRVIALQLLLLAMGAVASRYGLRSMVATLRRMPTPDISEPRKHVVIVGAGFAGMQAARKLRNAPVDVTIVDRSNHHLFQPLLYQVATSILSPSDIAVPIRSALRKQRNATTLLGRVTDVRLDARTVVLEGRKELTYDFLLLAAGARHSYFGHEGWEACAPGLKSLDDALEIRRRVLLAFERAEMTDDPETRAMEQTIVVVGGGPTGVELAGAIPEMVQNTLAADFRRADTRCTRIVLIERGPRLLPALDPKLSTRAQKDLEALGVEIRTNVEVTEITDDAVYLGNERIPTRTVMWAAGNVANPLGRLLDTPVDRSGRVRVTPYLSLPNYPEVFIAGDMAAIASGGVSVPPVATAANQMGRTVARNILAAIARRPQSQFVYRDKGSLAIINRRAAVAQIGRLRIRGSLASALWALVHLAHLVSHRSRVRVFAEWVYAHITHDRGYRLITGTSGLSPRDTVRPLQRINHDGERAATRRGA